MTHRRPPVTCIAVHPAGHFFVIGHADGTLAFWAVEDEDHPLFVRTIDNLDETNIVDGHKIEEYLPGGSVDSKTRPPSVDREPIFKLAWSGFNNSSDPRGGETALTVMGGLLAGDGAGVSVLWLPPFNPPEQPASTGVHNGLNPLIRQAMRDSLIPSKTFFYSTLGPTQDFLLMPRESPHFSGTFDISSILFLSDAAGGTRAIEAFQFPPPEFLAPPAAPEPFVPTTAGKPDITDTSDVLSDDLASTLEAMRMTDDPKRLGLPTLLWNGSSGVIHCEIVKLDRDAYETLTGASNTTYDELPLKGGIAWTNETKASEAKMSKVRTI